MLGVTHINAQALYSVSRPLNHGSGSASPKSGGTPGSSSGKSPM